MFKRIIPFASAALLLFSCGGNGGGALEQAEFMLSSDHETLVEGKSATVYLDWKPANTIKFESFTFTADPEKDNEISFDQTDNPRPMPVKITFKKDITEDISGTLSFAYNDITTKTKCENSIDITISKPEPEPTEIKIEKLTRLDGGSYALTSEEFSVTTGEKITFTIPVGALTQQYFEYSAFNSLVFTCDGSEGQGFYLAEKPTSFKYNNDDVVFSDEDAETWMLAAFGEDPTYNNTYITSDIMEVGPALFFEHIDPSLQDNIIITFVSAIEKENITALFMNTSAK